MIHPDGSVHIYRSTKFPLLDESGKVIGVSWTAPRSPSSSTRRRSIIPVSCVCRWTCDVSAVAATHAALKHSASTDPLTGLLNRRAWDTRLSMLIAELADGVATTIAVIDLDNFKSYNDTLGHTAGDALLQHFSTAAGASIRNGDVFARWGGEEFLLALPTRKPMRRRSF